MLSHIRGLEIGPGLSSAVCGRMIAELGADVVRVVGTGEQDGGGSVALRVQNLGKRQVEADLTSAAGRDRVSTVAAKCDLIVSSLSPVDMGRTGVTPEWLREAGQGAVIVCVTPFGLTGPRSRGRGGDLATFHLSGTARPLGGQVEDIEKTPPVRAAGEQSEFVAGVTAACAAMHALYGRGPSPLQEAQVAQGALRKERGPSTGPGRADESQSAQGWLIDVSVQEAMACMAPLELAQPGFGKPAPSRRRVLDGGGATVCILPASDGFVAVSPREEHQWQSWLGVMGRPAWGGDPRFASKQLRMDNWDGLYALMCEWSRGRTKEETYRQAQAAHVPGFPISTPADLLRSEHLRSRGFFRRVKWDGGREVEVPGMPYTFEGEPGPSTGTGRTVQAIAPLSKGEGPSPSSPHIARTSGGHPSRAEGGRPKLPLEGLRVLDFSWVIAGPACTRYLAAMGAEVIKVETSARPDPGRVSELHSVLGQSKLAITLDLKRPDGLDIAKKLVAESDVVVENFATGVMERLGLGYAEMARLRPDVVMLSASGFGRKGPDADKVAYGTLIQCYTGFAAMNGYPAQPPRVGMAWADPACALMMAFAVVAALDARRRTGAGTRIDFSMVEAMLSTMPGPLVEYQLTGRLPEPQGNGDAVFSPHGVFRCAGDDAWVAVAVTGDEEWRALCKVLGAPREWSGWGLAVRRERTGEIEQGVAKWAAARPDRDAMRLLQAAGVPASGSFTVADLFADAHLKGRGFFREVREQGGVVRRLPGLPWRIAAGPQPRHEGAPALGQDTARVLRDMLGMTDREIAKLMAAGALS